MSLHQGPAAAVRARRLSLVVALVLLSVFVVSGYTCAANAQTLKINFQPRHVTVPAGYLADSGEAYGGRENGYTYGWAASHEGDTYYNERFPSKDPNPYYSSIFMQESAVTKWELAVANGTYQVSIAAGSSVSAFDLQRISVEDVVAVDSVVYPYSPWVGATVSVTVSDGNLTVTNGPGGTTNSLCFIWVTPE